MKRKKAIKPKRAIQVSRDVTIQVPEKYMEGEHRRGKLGLYHSSHVPRIEQLARIGLTLYQIAIAFGINDQTLSRWLRDKPELREAYEKGRDTHDYAVQDAMLTRATGFDYVEEKEFEGVDAFGRPYHYTVRTKKKVLSDVTAGIFWLKNRHPDQWSDVNKHEIRTEVDIKNTLRLENLDDDERALLRRIAMKKIAQGNGTNG